MQKITNLYSQITSTENNKYPILERAISFGLPILGVIGFSAIGTHGQINIEQYKSAVNYSLFARDYSTWGLPAAIGIYTGTQTIVTYLKPKIEKIENKCFKSIASNAIELVDTLNNTLPYTVAYNILPGTYKANAVFGFKVLPNIFSGVESDIKSAINGTKYTPTFAREVYASMISGLISKNVAQILSNKIKVAETADNKDKTKEIIASSLDKALIEAGVDSILYALGKKYLIGKKYTESQIKLDVFKGFAQEMLFGSNYCNKTAIPGLKYSAFDNISQFAAVELLTLYTDKFCGSFETKPTKQEIFHKICDNCSDEELAYFQSHIEELLAAA